MVSTPPPEFVNSNERYSKAFYAEGLKLSITLQGTTFTCVLCPQNKSRGRQPSSKSAVHYYTNFNMF